MRATPHDGPSDHHQTNTISDSCGCPSATCSSFNRCIFPLLWLHIRLPSHATLSNSRWKRMRISDDAKDYFLVSLPASSAASAAACPVPPISPLSVNLKYQLPFSNRDFYSKRPQSPIEVGKRCTYCLPITPSLEKGPPTTHRQQELPSEPKGRL